MSIPICVFDPTEKDALSKVRGIGRYLQLLKENFSGKFIFTAYLSNISYNSIFINPFFNFLQTPLLMKRISQKQIAVIHDLITLKYPKHFPVGIRGKINILLNKLALRNYDLIITDSIASKKDIIQMLQIDEDKIKVVYPCLPKMFINHKLQTSNPQENIKLQKSKLLGSLNLEFGNYCLYVGDATWNKNLVNVAKAIKLANINCYFVGKVFEARNNLLKTNHSWQQSLKDFFTIAKNDRRFIFPGFVTDQVLLKLYQLAFVNMLVSSDEGFGFSYLEASSQACPSILSNISTFKEISNNKCLFVDPNSPKAIADKIKKLLKDRVLRNKVGFEALERSKYFSPEKFQKEFWRCLS